jgi:hypothetical protein
MKTPLDYLTDHLELLDRGHPDSPAKRIERDDLYQHISDLRDKEARRTRNPAPFVACHDGDEVIHTYAFGNTPEEARAEYKAQYGDEENIHVGVPVVPRFGEQLMIRIDDVLEETECRDQEWMMEDCGIAMSPSQEKWLSRKLSERLQELLEEAGLAYKHWMVQ